MAEGKRQVRKIPEATVARLPVYLRSLLEAAGDGTPTISSERLAELAGVNAAKVRKDLSYLGSYGTRGVGYDVEYLLFQMSRELGLTQDWPVVIVGIGNLGHALANYGGFAERGFPVAALVDADPARSAAPTSAASRCATSTTCRRHRRRARHRHRHHRHARRRPPRTSPTAWSPPGSASILNFAPAIVTVPPEVSLRKVDLAVELQILSFYQQRRGVDAGCAADAADAGRRAPCGSDDRAGRPAPLPGEPRARGPAGASSSAAGGSRAGRCGACSTPGAAVHVVAPEVVATRSPALGATCVERAALPRRARRPATGSSIAATDDPRVNQQVFDDGEAAGVWVNSADDPANCSFTLPARVRRGGSLVTVSTGGRSPALAAVAARAPRRASSGPSTTSCSTCWPRHATSVRGRGSSHRGPRLAAGARFGDAGPDPRGPARRSQGAPPGVSVVVIGLNHRTVPLDLLERMTVDDARSRRRCTTCARGRARQRGGRAVDLQPHRGLRGRRAVPRRRTATSATSSPSSSFLPPEEFADHLYVHYDDAAVAHLFAVAAGLDSAVLGESEILGQVACAWERRPRRGRRRPRAQPAVPPRPRGRQAGPHRDRHRPQHRVGVAGRGGPGRRAPRRRSTGAACSCSAPARWARAWPSRWPAPASPRSASPTAPAAGPTTLAARVGGRAVRLLDARPTRSARRRRAAHLHRCAGADARARPTSTPSWPAVPAARCSSSTSPCPATSTPRWPSSPASRCSTWTTSGPFAEAGVAERRREVAAVEAIVDDELDRYLGGHVGPRGRAAGRRAARPGRGGPQRRARALRGRARRPRRPPARRGRGAHPGHRGQAAARADRAAQGRGRHRPGERLADALRELFEIEG